MVSRNRWQGALQIEGRAVLVIVTVVRSYGREPPSFSAPEILLAHSHSAHGQDIE